MSPTPTMPRPAMVPPAPRPMAAAKKPNIWLVISIILAIALVGVVAVMMLQNKGGITVLTPDKAGSTLISFINKVYGQQVGTATLKTITDENGLYKIVLTVTQNNAPVDQTVYVSKDGKLFIPQALNIEDMLKQFEAYQAQQQNPTTPPADTNVNDNTNANTNTNQPAADTNTNTEPAQ